MKTLHTASHLEAKDTLHPTTSELKELPLKTVFTASHLTQERTLHPR